MSFDLVEYYKAINGESSLSRDTWHVNYDKRHAFKISSDFDALDEYGEKIFLPASEEEIETVNIFSSQLNQKISNTQIIKEEDGTEKVELDLDDRIVTIIMDQSGSMTWNDNGTFRHDIAKQLVEKIGDNYPGDTKYNLLTYGADYVNILFFGILEEEGTDIYNFNSVSSLIYADDEANFAGIRVIRNEDHYPTSHLDGEMISDGFISKVFDTDLIADNTYYYKVFTYDKNLKFSEGVSIKVTPKTRSIPRGISLFRTPIDSDDLTTGYAYQGIGTNKDDNVLGLWHFNEGDGVYLYDFSSSGLVLEINEEEPTWYNTLFTPTGNSALFLDGVTNKISIDDDEDNLKISLDEVGNQITLMGWIYPYSLNDSAIMSRESSDGSDINYTLGIKSNTLSFHNGTSYTSASVLTLSIYQWQFVAVSYDSTTEEVTFYVDGVSETKSLSTNPSIPLSIGNLSFIIGNSSSSDFGAFRGKVTEVSVHNIVRSATYIDSQIEENDIYDDDQVVVDIEYIGRSNDNGDRLVVLRYEIPSDFNFVGGEVIIVKNETRIPTWEEDGEIIYQTIATAGIHFVLDSDDFVLGETYYYRIFSKNILGNISFSSDSSSLTVNIEKTAYNAENDFLELETSMVGPEAPTIVSPITAGNKKVYIRWRNTEPSDTRVKRVKIYHASLDYPVVSADGKTGGTGRLVYTGLSTDTGFVHRDLDNDVDAYYTVVFVDKYGRSSNYNSNGIQISNFFHYVATPTSGADESTMPLDDVDNLHYELVDPNSVTVSWDQPQKNPDNLSAYFDQTVILYASIMDEFGQPISTYTQTKMFITPTIVRDTQADNVFGDGTQKSFTDSDVYEFFATRTDEGFMRAVLRMTSDTEIISGIKSASFTIQVKSYIPKDGYVLPNTDIISSDPLSNYVSILNTLLDDVDGDQGLSTESANVFEYTSKPIIVSFTNPWELEIVNRDEKYVGERCYIQKLDEITKKYYLDVVDQSFNGVYIKASSPFVSRVKVKYKGESVESGSIQIAVWDADSSSLCRKAGIKDALPYEGEKVNVSSTVLIPDVKMSLLSGTEDYYDEQGRSAQRTISYVDIPLYAPDLPQAIRLFAKSKKSGYSSIKDLYILFQSTLIVNIDVNRPRIDGKEVAEQQAIVFIINPDYPDYYDNDYHKSLITYPANNTIAKWNLLKVNGDTYRSIYSVDNVPLINGVYSYIRNGTARNVFFGPIETSDEDFEEIHEVNVTVVYQGLTSTARQYIDLRYYVNEEDEFGARFLMEMDGGPTSSGGWGGKGWFSSYSPPMWADGSDYRRVKIARNPRIASTDDFDSADCFRGCAVEDDSELIELNSGQEVTIQISDGVEILHGEISEDTNPYTGEMFLTVGEDGFINEGSADIELENEEDSDITYFYVRFNAFVPDAGVQFDELCWINEDPINPCLCLGRGSSGLIQCDIPQYSPVYYVSGTTTTFVNNRPLVLKGGGSFYTGIPPCPFALKEPLGFFVMWRRITNYYGNSEDPSSFQSVTYEVENDNFYDEDGVSLITPNSDIEIRIKFTWRNSVLPDGTPIYVSVGDNSANTLFIARRNVYRTETDTDINTGKEYSYVDVVIEPRRVATETETEAIEVFSVYDKKGTTSRHMGQFFYLTMEKKDSVTSIDPPVIVEPSTPPITSYSRSSERYNIYTNEWDLVTAMSEKRGNAFIGNVDTYIYVMGGLKSNDMDISNKNERYNANLDEWEFVTPMTSSRFGGHTVVVGNDIYVIGGIGRSEDTNSLQVSTICEVYHTLTDTWETLEHMSILNEGRNLEERLGVAFGAAQHIIINAKNYIYIISGVNSFQISESSKYFKIGKFSERILRYCIEDDEWVYSNVLRSDELVTYRRISPLSLVYNGKIVVFNGAIESNEEFIYPSEDFSILIEESFSKTTSERWISIGSGYMGDFPRPKYQSGMVAYDVDPSDETQYFILGGANDKAGSLDILEKITTTNVFEYESSYDTDISSVLNSMTTAKHGAGSVLCWVTDEYLGLVPYIYVIGGFTIARDNDYIDIIFDI